MTPIVEPLIKKQVVFQQMTYCASSKLFVRLIFSFDVNKEKTPHDILKERIRSLIIKIYERFQH